MAMARNEKHDIFLLSSVHQCRVRPKKSPVELPMSAKLVRKLLKQTSELDFTEDKTDGSAFKGSKKRKRPKEEQVAPVDTKKLLQLHVQTMIRVDNVIEARGEADQRSLERLQKERKTQSKLRSKAKHIDGGVGNSRGSSSQKSRPVHVPTINKKRYAQEKKEKTLRDIAKLLKKTKKKPW